MDSFCRRWFCLLYLFCLLTFRGGFFEGDQIQIIRFLILHVAGQISTMKALYLIIVGRRREGCFSWMVCEWKTRR